VCDQIRAVGKQRFGKVQSQLSHDDMVKLDTNLKVVLGL
jgi:mRNA-degrading endonuclease toxin of MazEF toxin-antitoxin module